ncbi:hypothetical protein Sjap_009678 [Stephania japonica]|uniref:C2 NT-type domain-containing protein n=1 Tax=Stephania japonica TaxID=461633 RepID=A0AAP0P6E6_9MAGN
MAAKPPERRNSNTLLLEELESLSQSLYQSHTRRTASLALPRTSVPSASTADPVTKYEDKPERPRSRRMSLSPWRSRPKLETDQREKETADEPDIDIGRGSLAEKKGKIWNWKPIRALSHIGMQKLSCLFSVEIVAVEGLPASMNGLRLSACVRKKETKDGAVQTMPARVVQGAADFEEILFVRCHVYCSSVAGGSGKQVKFEPRPFLIYAFAVDAEELDFGRNCVDLSLLVQESVEKNLEGMRVRQWDKSFGLSGKAKGGKLLVKLGFQIMEKDGGLGIYSQGEGLKKGSKGGEGSSTFARKHSKSSFSVSSPRMSSRGVEASSPTNAGAAPGADIHGMDELNLDEPSDPKPPTSSSSALKSKEPMESKMEDLDIPDFDVVDKGVEIQERPTDSEKAESEEAFDEKSVSSEVVKEVVHDKVHLTRLTELDSIAKQIKALESMMEDGRSVKSEEETTSQRLDADEETVTREFLQMLEEEEEANKYLHWADSPRFKAEGALKEGGAEGAGSDVYMPDLGKGLGCVVQTKDGGYLAAMNPFNVKVPRKETPKLAMQLSKPLVLRLQKSSSGFEVFQKMAAVGPEELGPQIFSFMPIDELVGKTAEQTAFEGIASAIIQGRNKEGASSSAARSVASLKTMSTAMIKGRKERVSTGIWNVDEEPVPLNEILALSMQKIEAMAIEALKIQADMAEEDAPFDVSPLIEKTVQGANSFPLASALPLEDWFKNENPLTDTESVILSASLQLRDPLRRYEGVGSPLIILIQATRAESSESKGDDDEEEVFKVVSLHVGCLRVRMRGKRNSWDSEKRRLTAVQWLVGYNLGKAGKKGKHAQATGPDCFWSISSRIMADMWLKSMRNPDIKFTKKHKKTTKPNRANRDRFGCGFEDLQFDGSL